MSRLARYLVLLAAAMLAHTAASAHPPWSLAVDSAGRVYFSDLEAVWRLDADRSVHLLRRGVSGRHVHEFRIDSAGRLIGEELRYDPARQVYHAGIWAITPGGRQSWLVAPTSSPARGRGIWSDGAGNSFQVQWNNNEQAKLLAFRRDSRGRVSQLVGSSADAAGFATIVLYNASGFVIAPAGGAYFTDRTSLYSYAPRRGVSRLLQIRGATLRGVALGQDGRLYIADSAGRRVLRRSADGGLTTILRSSPGWTPHGVAPSADALFVLEFSDYRRGVQPKLRIRKLDRQGKVTLLTVRPTA